MSIDIEKIWQESSWTVQARKLVEGLNKFPKNSKINLFLRHSHRIESNEVEDMLYLSLTRKGQEAAKRFGELLPKDRPLQLFFSISPRCRETAEEILRGFESASGSGKLKGSIRFLYSAGGKYHYFTDQVLKNPGYKFIEKWASGAFPEDKITPLAKYSTRTASVIKRKLDRAPPRCLNIYVTHDSFLVGLRTSWFSLTTKAWPSYLGGFAFCLHDNTAYLLDIDETTFQEIRFSIIY